MASTPTTTRRALALSVGAFTAVGTTAGAAANIAGCASSNQDAELIAVCAQHAVTFAAYNRDGGILRMEDDPLWHSYAETCDVIRNAKPVTVSGMLAKARAAKLEATMPDGDEEPAGTIAEAWAWDLVNDLLRISGRA